LLGVAVKATVEPEQMEVPCADDTTTVGAAFEFTVMEMTLLALVIGLGQEAVLVIRQATTSPLAREAVE
jgi:hypothetical protein